MDDRRICRPTRLCHRSVGSRRLMIDCCNSVELKDKWRAQQLVFRVFRVGPISSGRRSRCIGCHLAFTMSQPRWSAARNPHCNKKTLEGRADPPLLQLRTCTHLTIHVRKMCKTTTVQAGNTQILRVHTGANNQSKLCKTTAVQAVNTPLLRVHTCANNQSKWCKSTSVQAGSTPLLRVHTQPIGIVQGNNCRDGT